MIDETCVATNWMDWIEIAALLPCVAMLWLMLSGAFIIWWRLVVSPGTRDGIR